MKLRGLIVGEVREVALRRRDGATLDLALEPDQVELIPGNVSARLLPKTLFGEKYVDLVLPAEPARRGRSREGDVIPQDRTERRDRDSSRCWTTCCRCCARSSRQQLNATLNALATALRRPRRPARRQPRAGRRATSAQLNPSCRPWRRTSPGWPTSPTSTPTPRPTCCSCCDNLSVDQPTTVAQKQDGYAGFLLGTHRLRRRPRAPSLRENENRLIQLAGEPAHAARPRASTRPEYPCLLEGLATPSSPISRATVRRRCSPGCTSPSRSSTAATASYKPGRGAAVQRRSAGRLPRPAEPRTARRTPTPSVTSSDGSTGHDGGSPPHRGAGPCPASWSTPPAGMPARPRSSRWSTRLPRRCMGVPADEVPDLATLLFGPMARGTVVRQP